MALDIYAGATATGMTKLPSPTDLKPSYEIIWSENTGRAQSGTNKAKMVGDVVAEKITYNIQWGILTQAQLDSIKSKLTAGFFYFGIGTTATQASNSAKKFYRGNIQYDLVPVGNTLYYKSVAVDVIEQ